MRYIAAFVALFTLSMLGSPASPARAAGSPRLDRTERNVIRAINHQRAAYGRGRVRDNGALNRAADYHSAEMAYGNYFAHTSRNGASMAARVRSFKHSRRVGETLAMLGGPCRRHMASRVVSMWMHSSPHRAVLLAHGFSRIGVSRRGGHLAGQRACMVTADFASRR
jgi:uncharacterized protein YkwD